MKISKIDWKSEPPIREKILFAFVPLIILIPFVKASWTPLEGSITVAKADYEIVQTQIEAIRKMLDMAEKQTRTTTTIIEQRSKVNDRVMRILNRQSSDPNKEVADVINALSSRELTQRVMLHDIVVGNEISTPTYTAMPLIVSIEGGYGAIEKYLSSIEAIEKPFLVRGVEIKGNKEDEGATIMANLNVLVYLAVSRSNIPKQGG